MAELPAVLAVSDGCRGRLPMAVRLVIIKLSGGSVLEAWADGSLSVGPRLGDKCGRGLGRDFQGVEIRLLSFQSLFDSIWIMGNHPDCVRQCAMILVGF